MLVVPHPGRESTDLQAAHMTVGGQVQLPADTNAITCKETAGELYRGCGAAVSAAGSTPEPNGILCTGLYAIPTEQAPSEPRAGRSVPSRYQEPLNPAAS